MTTIDTKRHILERPAKLKAWMEFTLKGKRGIFVIVSIHHSDGTVSFVKDSDRHNPNPLEVTRIPQQELLDSVRNFVENELQLQTRLRREWQEAAEAAQNLAADWKAAILEDILFDARHGSEADQEENLFRLLSVMESESRTAYETGWEEGNENGFASGREQCQDSHY